MRRFFSATDKVVRSNGYAVPINSTTETTIVRKHINIYLIKLTIIIILTIR